MKKVWKFVGIGGLVVAVVLGSTAAVAFAQGPNGENQGTFNFHERFRQALASILGISVEQYDKAVAQAQEQVLKDAVAEGWLTQEQADRMRLRMEQMPGPMPWRMGRGFGRHGMLWGGMGRGPELLSIAAKQLNMSVYDLGKALQEGKSIADVAKEKGVDPQTIVDAYLARVSEQLNQAVEDGRITQKVADAMLEQARQWATNRINATWPYPSPGGFGRFRRGGPFRGIPQTPNEGGS